MAIKLQCPCGKALSVKDEFAGRRVKCPACQSPITVPKPKDASLGDDWDLGDSDEEEFDDAPPTTRAKSRGGKSLPVSDTNSRLRSVKAKGRKSKQSNRGLMMGLSVGGGLVAIALLAWMLWPARPGPDVAAAPNQNTAGSASTTGGDSTASTSTASVDPNTQPNAGPANPSTPIAAIATKLEGDLKFLQGTWQVTDIEMPPDAPGGAEEVAQSKLITFTIKDDLLTMTTPGGTGFQTIKIDPLQTPKRIDLTPLEADRLTRTQLGIYSIEGETWQMCSTQGGTDRPQEMKAAPGRAVITFKRSSASLAATASSFDIKAWLAAESKLKAMKVKASLGKWGNFAGVTGPTHVVTLSLPETSDGTMSPELWAIVSSINHIAVRTSFVTDATLRQLAQHPGLLGIVIETRSTVTADGIGALKACPQLGTFMFYAPISPELCEAVTQLDQLRTLGISDSPVSGEMMGSICRLNQLESLSLNNTVVADEDFLQVQKLTKLKGLHLNKSTVSDAGLKTLTNLTHLETLSLDETKVTGEGLKSLESLSGLKSLWLQGLNIAPEAVAAFEAAVPKCRVVK